MRARILITAVIAIVTLWGCGKVTSPPPQATVQLKDGSSFSGAVTNSSTEQISVQASTGETRTYPMSQVASVQYAQSDAAAAPVTTQPPAPVTTQAPPPVSQRVEEVLLQEQVTNLLQDWLKSLRAQGSVQMMKPGEMAP